MPRRNRRAQRKRATEIQRQDTPNRTPDDLARDLVRRGLATINIIEGARGDR